MSHTISSGISFYLDYCKEILYEILSRYTLDYITCKKFCIILQSL